MKRSFMALVSVLSAAMVMGMLVIGLSQTAHDLARTRLETAIPAYAAKVEKTVAELQGETPAESVSNLYYVNDYFDPGPNENGMHVEMPLPSYVGQIDVDAIMSNRRFLKSFAELSKMDKAKASQMVKANLSSAVTSYLHLYESEKQARSQYAKTNISNTPISYMIPSFIIRTRPGEGSEVLLGERLKVFSLVWISGMLKLTDNKVEVEQVVRLAIKQRTELCEDLTLSPIFREEMLRRASLYNRQILSSGLLGVTFRDAGLESNVMTAADIHWQQKKLVAYDAALTEFDKPAAVMALDRSTGTLTVNFVSPMHDTNFDLLLQAVHFK